MRASLNNHQYFNALHDVFSVDYHEVNQYLLELYVRPKQFIDETGPPLDRFLREYTIPGLPRQNAVPTRAVLEFIGQIDEFSAQTSGLFDEHKAYVEECSKFMERASILKLPAEESNTEIISDYTELTPELIRVHQGLIKIKEKADFMAERLQNLQNRWSGIKDAING